MITVSESPHIQTVSELNQQVREMLLAHFSQVCVQGEISNMKRHSSGHWYFTLKDATSELRCAMFRSNNQYVSFVPDDGDMVRAFGRLEIYVQRGNYQLVVQELQEEGRGELLRRLEELKLQLNREGLFDAERKSPLPDYPAALGVVTSESGAALRDVARTLRRRWPATKLYVYPAMVEGPDAAETLCKALNLAITHHQCDALLLVRGGGNFESLLAFSDEALVRAVAACPIPIVSGIGHETDTHLADFAADLHAATPTAAAEQASPDGRAIKEELDRRITRNLRNITRVLEQARQASQSCEHRLTQTHPARKIQIHQQRLDDLSDHLRTYLNHRLRRHQDHLVLVWQRLDACAPHEHLSSLRQTLTHTQQRLQQAMLSLQRAREARLQRACGTLRAVGPQQTLDRGYAIPTLQTPEGAKILRTLDQVQVGSSFELRLARGGLDAEVTRVDPVDSEST